MAVNKPGDTSDEPVDKQVAERGPGRNPRQHRDFGDPPLRVCPFDLDGVISELEAERYGRAVPEFRPAFSRDYLDLLALADADIRARDDKKRDTA